MRRGAYNDDLVEDYPALAMAQLKPFDMFGDLRDPNWVVSLKVGHLATSFSFDPVKQVLRVEFPKRSGGGSQNIRIKRVPLQFGDRIFFICPKTGRTCAKLYLKGGVLASRQGHNLVYGSQSDEESQWSARVSRLVAKLHGTESKGPARGARRAAIIDELRELRRYRILDKATEDVLREDEKRRAKLAGAAPKPKAKGPLSTEAGMAAAKKRGYLSPSVVAATLSEPIERLRSGWRPPMEPLPRSTLPASVADFPKLDITVLAKAWSEPGNGGQNVLVWKDRTTGESLEIWMVVRRNESPAFAYIMFWRGDEPDPMDGQVIELERDPGGSPRFYFRCPVTGVRCDALFYRGGIFASREVQKLVYPSQRSMDPWAVARRRDRVRRQAIGITE